MFIQNTFALHVKKFLEFVNPLCSFGLHVLLGHESKYILLQVDLVYAHGESSRPQKRDWQAMMLQVNSTHTGKLTFTVKQWDTQRRKQCNHQNLFEWLQMLKSMYITFQASLGGKLFKKIFLKKLILTQNFGM